MEEKVVIEFKDLKFKYAENDDYVLKGLDLKIFHGQIIGYIGLNGAGKTTTIKLILNLLSDYEGKIEVFNKDIKLDKVTYKYKIGYVPENAYLYENLTGFEFLEFLGKIYKISNIELPKRIEKLSSFVNFLWVFFRYYFNSNCFCYTRFLCATSHCMHFNIIRNTFMEILR